MSSRKGLRFAPILLAAAAMAFAPRTGSAQVVHLHDSESEQKAREALATLGKLPETSVFQAMLRNLDAAHQLSLAVQWERGQATMTDRVDRTVEWDWNMFAQKVEQSENEFSAACKKALLMRRESALGLESLTLRVQTAEAQIRAAKEQLAHHDAGEKEVNQAVEHYQSAISEIQKIAADPDLAKKLRNLQLDKTQGYLKKLQDLAKQADTAAGLRPVYLDLGLSLAILEVNELRAEVEYDRWMLDTASQRLRRFGKLLGGEDADSASASDPEDDDPPDDAAHVAEPGDFEAILEAARPSGEPQGKNAFGAPGEELIMVTLERLAKSAHQEQTSGSRPPAGGKSDERFSSWSRLQQLLADLATYASIVSYQAFLLEVDESEDNYHLRRESIVLTQIEDRKLDFLLTHSLQGVLGYEGGGVRPMDVLNTVGGLRP